VKLFIAFGVVAAAGAAFKFLPWWAGVGVGIALGLAAKLLLGTLFKRRFIGMFEMKSAVLRGAAATLHSITPASEPKPDFEDEFADFDVDSGVEPLAATVLSWRYIDVTIDLADRPSEGSSDSMTGSMTMWEPSELLLVEPTARSGKAPNIDRFGDELGEIQSVDIMQGGNWVPLEGDRVIGSQRLRLHVGVPPTSDAFKLRYYFEVLKNAPNEASP